MVTVLELSQVFMGLLCLPDEILNLTLKFLLPPFRSQSLAETYVFTVPVDLLVARLVSRRLHRIATPLAWRRAQIQIASPLAMNYGNYGNPPAILTHMTNSFCSTIRVAVPPSFRSLVRCRFFQEHPELAAHVRVLLISIEWQAESPTLARDALREATNNMSNLRTVLVWDADVLAANDIRQILQKPLLRMICLMDVDGSAFPAQCDFGGGLKMLHIANSICPARLIASAGTALECVSIEMARTCPAAPSMLTLRGMPWKTLKEVALVDCVNESDWCSFLDGFEPPAQHDILVVIRPPESSGPFDRSCFRGWIEYGFNEHQIQKELARCLCCLLHRSLGLHTALTELMIGDLAGLDAVRVDQLLHTFAGQPLTRLTLYHVMTLDPPTLSGIVKAFPVLLHLTLLSESELAPWPGALDAYAEILADLSRLQSLAWNNFYLDPALDSAFLLLNNDALRMMYAKHVHTLVGHVRQLRCIKFTSVADCIVDTVYIRGMTRSKSSSKSRSRGVDPLEVMRMTEAALHTSSWSTTSGVVQDL